MAFTPDTVLYLCFVPIDITQQNQLKFSSAALQEAYFATTVKHTYDNITYQRKDSTVLVASHIDSIWDANYCMYQNTNFGTKWFYAFIEKMEWVSDGTTRIYLKTDVYQTWMLDCTLMDSFIVREHIASDSIGASLVEESLDTGEYIKTAVTTASGMDTLAVILAVTEYTVDGGINWSDVQGGMYAGIYSGLAYWAFWGAGVTGAVNSFINDYQDGHEAAIVSIFMIPVDALPSGSTSGNQVPYDTLLGTSVTKAVTYSTTQLGSYTAKNKKLLQYPYHFLHVSNLAGQSADYRFELTYDKSGTFNFAYRTNIAPGAKTLLIPLSGYKRTTTALDNNSEEAITMQNYPMCAWLSDAWSNWIAQNALTVGVGLAGGVAALGAGIATGSGIAMAGGAASIANQMAQLYKHAIEPDHAQGNLNGSTVNIAWGLQHFQFCEMAVTPEYAARIDEYFEMFGYKTNRVKVPNVTGRPFWNYVQCIDVNILGDIPAEDMVQLKAIYNKGVTLWHSPYDVGDYSQNNH